MKTAVFDSRWILEKPSGIGVYALELARRLPALLPGWRFIFLAEDEAGRKRLVAELTASALAGGNILPVGYGPVSIKNQLRLPGLLRELGADLYHAPNFMLPFRAFRKGGGAPIRCIATIHDVIPLVVPGYAPHSRTAKMKSVYRWCLRQAALRSDALFTVSERSKADILRALALPAEAAARIRAGKSVLIFPEGTRSADGRLQAFKGGAVLLAIKAGAPLVPLGFNGSHQILPKGHWLPNSGEITLRVGRPIPTEGLKTRDRQRLADELHRAVAELLDAAHRPLPETTDAASGENPATGAAE